MNKSLLIDEYLNQELETNGFIVLPFLSQDIVDELIHFYQLTNKQKLTGFHATMFNPDLNYRYEVNRFIQSKLENSLSKIFSDNYSVLYSNFLVKESGEESNMKWHQDWSYVDETMEDSFAIWTPLVDLNEHNGVFTVAEKSHKLKNYVRGPGVEDAFISKAFVSEKYSTKPLYLKAGEAVIWHHRLLHCSPSNNTSIPRISATCILTPKNARIVHFYKEISSKFINEYTVNSDFYLNNNISECPKTLVNRKFNYYFDTLSNTQKIEKINALDTIRSFFNL